MIKSMTGYGKASQESDSFDITVEVKTLNSKYLDINLKLPRLFGEREIEVRQLISEKLQRGKVSLAVDFRGKGQLGGEPSVNQELLKAYYQLYKQTAGELDAPQQDLFRLAVQSPDVLQPIVQESADQEVWKVVKQVIEEALQQCNQFRSQEGDALMKDFSQCATNIKIALEEVKKQAPIRDQRLRQKLQTQMEDSFAKDIVDQNRFEQELIYYIEKLDVNEEIVRLSNHLDYFKEVLHSPDVHGKKLGFISQEMGREINTIGSKANDASIQRSVVGMKEELEKIKEQVLNVL
ncbi:YicC family protein [Porifericola rhodea]|uniref:YicC/YloC family endoribonuclease n=1 Tax=Porifericola rhodea TaxID=930972 RepID=UPI0026664ACD|nr:YicC/YloC family endoribonuclease [Porifericola rhodea]WKN33455.1 YicC family protein [Porifericola rhodea]